jgi:hypothetical protein
MTRVAGHSRIINQVRHAFGDSMGSWTLDDIPWHRFDAARLDAGIVAVVKAASLVEYNGAAYAGHLCNVFAGDPEFQTRARKWGEEEVQHGAALACWAALADPEFDFTAAFARFRDGYRIDLAGSYARRGSRAGEMIARCVVETGTSAYYTALREAAREPVLQEICRRIAADELRHYRLFYKTLCAYQVRERLGRWARLKIALGRLAESEDDELAYAYYAANEPANESGLPYDRRRYSRVYGARAAALYRAHHVERMVAMVLKAVGLTPNGKLGSVLSLLAWRAMRYRAGRFVKAEA